MTTTQPTSPRTSAGSLYAVVVIDDHPLLRRGLSELINSNQAFRVVGETGSATEAFRIISETRPQVVVVDISIQGGDGIELIKGIAYRWPSIALLAYSMHDERVYAERAVRAGAKGYLMKNSPPEIFLEALTKVAQGTVYLSPEMSSRLLNKMIGAGRTDSESISSISSLSDRELEVLRLIGGGMKTSHIAEQLSLSIKTIETYREHLKRKLGLSNGVELMRYAIEWSLAQK